MSTHIAGTGKISHNKLSFKALKRSMVTASLYLFYFLTGRRLQLAFISKPDAIIFMNGSLRLYWNVRGCHRITVNNNIILPGNRSSIHLDPAKLSDRLIFCFYGCGQAIRKTFKIQPVSLSAPQLSTSYTHNSTFHTKHIRLHYNSRQGRSGSILLPASISSAQLRLRPELFTAVIRQPELRVQLESCEPPDYNP